jgi:16S rRNA (adenine1518-N6/adenine1519-N6)-dimethyltransferase
MSLKDELLVKMHELGIQPKRSLGQNFLIGEHVVEKIFEHVDRREPKMIVEVGPGLGALTERLIERNSKRLLIELDSQFAKYWQKRGENVLEVDALECDWKKLDLPVNTLVLSNLPYQIGSRLVIELSLGPNEVDVLVFMFQKEVAERLDAKVSAKDYGFLSVVAQTFWSINHVVDASREDFFPSPNVLSRVISLKRKNIDARFDQRYIDFIKACFQFRRKYLLKAFKAESAEMKVIFQKLGLSESVRGEELSPQIFQQLYLMKNFGVKE